MHKKQNHFLSINSVPYESAFSNEPIVELNGQVKDLPTTTTVQDKDLLETSELQYLSDMSRSAKSLEFAKTVFGESFQKERFLQRVALLGTIATMIAYEWGPINETVTAKVGFFVQENIVNNVFNDPESVKNMLLSSVVVGGTIASFTALQQGVAGLLMVGGINELPKTFGFIEKIKKLKRKNENIEILENENTEEKESLYDRGTALLIGSDAAVLEANIKNPEMTKKEQIKIALGSAALIGTANTALFGVLSYGFQAAENAGISTVGVEDRLTDWKTWFLLWGGYKAGKYGINKTVSGTKHVITKLKAKKKEAQELNYNQSLPID